MKTIYKYPIEITDYQTIKIPINAKIIHTGLDPHGIPCLWAMVDLTNNQTQTITIYVVGTGNPIPNNVRQHIGSFNQGLFVWHIFIN